MSAPSRPPPPPPPRTASTTTRLSTPPDTIYRSLLALLASPNTSSAASHLHLLPPNSLYASISHYLSTLPPADVDGFVTQLVASPPLWYTVEQTAPHSSSQQQQHHLEGASSSSPPTPLPSLLDRSTALSQSIAHGVLNYVKLLLVDRSGNHGWQTRRTLAQWVRNVMLVAQRTHYEGVNFGSSETQTQTQAKVRRTSPVTSLPYLTILSGLLLGLAAHEAQRSEAKSKAGALSDSGLSARRIKGEVEEELCAFLSELLGQDSSSPSPSEKDQPQPKELLKTVQQAEKGGNPPAVEAKPESLNATTTNHEEQVTAPSETDWEKEFSARQVAFDSASSSSAVTKSTASTRPAAIPPSLLPGQAGAVPLLVLLSTVSPHMTEERLGVLPPLRTLELLSSLAIPGIFDPQVTQDIFSILGDSNAASNEKAVIALDSLQNLPLFPSLGPLARIASIAAAQAIEGGKVDALVQPDGLLEKMGQTASRWGEAWERVSPVVNVEGEEAKALRTRFWTIAKTLLFGYVMIYDGVMESIIDMCPSPTLSLPPPQSATLSSTSSPSSSVASTSTLPSSTRTSDGAKLRLTTRSDLTTSNIPASYIASISSILSSFSHLAFITSTFGPDAFEAYNRVLFGALEVLGRDKLACEAVLEELGLLARSSKSAGLERRVYYLDVAEQIAGFVSDEIVAKEVLEACKPYLESTTNKRAFESSHSVLLSILTSHAPLVSSLTPYYSSLILRLFPQELTDGQLEHALTTMVSAASDIDDALAWLVIERLSEEIERTRFLALGLRGDGSGDKGNSKSQVEEATKLDEAATAISDSSSKPPLIRLRTDPPSAYLALQKSLISLLPSLNLVLLRSVLDRCTRHILSHPSGSFERRQLCEKAFEALDGLNAATREEGLRWWLENRKRFGV